MENRELAERLIKMRKKAGLTQLNLSRKSDLTLNIVKLMEYKNDDTLKLGNVNKYLAVFGKKLKWRIGNV